MKTKIGIVFFVLVALALAGSYWFFRTQERFMTLEVLSEAVPRMRTFLDTPVEIAAQSDLLYPEIPELTGHFMPLDFPPTDLDGSVPDTFLVEFRCTNGRFVVEFVKEWSPLGVERVYDLLKENYYEDSHFIRVTDRLVQFGVPRMPGITLRWGVEGIEDEPVKVTNARGTIAFASSGRQGRRMQLFINKQDNPEFDHLGPGFPPLGRVVQGMDVVDAIYAGYGERPDPVQMGRSGPMYVFMEFPLLDAVRTTRFVEPAPEGYVPEEEDEEEFIREERMPPPMQMSGTPFTELPPYEEDSAEFAILDAPPSTPEGDLPDSFTAKFECSNGDFIVEFYQDWAPYGFERMYRLIAEGFFDDTRFYRVLPGFMVQFGIAADPEVTKKWIDKPLPDDIAQHSNERGMLSFAHRGPNTRTTQVFINYSNNTHLDSGEAPFAPVGRVLQGWDVVMDIYSEHRDYPDQMLIMREGNEYLDARFPGLEVLKRACFVERIE